MSHEDTKARKDKEDLARIAVDCGFRLHKELGPGLLESVYEVVLAKLLEREGLAPVHSKQLLTYLRLLDLPLGLLMNFGAATFKEGVKRVVNGPQSFASSCLRVNQSGASA
jgi:hypothetical protein